MEVMNVKQEIRPGLTFEDAKTGMKPLNTKPKHFDQHVPTLNKRGRPSYPFSHAEPLVARPSSVKKTSASRPG